MAQLLLGANATVTICHSRTRDLAEVCRRADVLVAAVGRDRMVKGDWVKPGATVIDVGINRSDDGLHGDVDFDEAVAGRRRHHAGPRRRGADDDRLPAAQHAAGGADGGGVSRLRAGEWTAAAGAAGLLVALFLPWFGIELPGPAGGLVRRRSSVERGRHERLEHPRLARHRASPWPPSAAPRGSRSRDRPGPARGPAGGRVRCSPRPPGTFAFVALALRALVFQPGPNDARRPALRRVARPARGARPGRRRLVGDQGRAHRRARERVHPARAAPGAAGRLDSAGPMIDREQVLHVARLARLELSDEEVTQDLRRAVQHPRAHREDRRARPRRRPADVARRRRRQRAARRRAAAVPAARGRARAGARRRRRRLPRPQPAGMTRQLSEHHRRSRAAQAARPPSRRAATSIAASSSRPTATRAAADELNAYLWVADEARRERQRRAAGRRAARGQGPLLHRGRAVAGRLADPRGLPPALHGHGRRQLAQAGAPLLGKTNQDEFAMGSSNENSGYGPGAQPVGPHARARRLVGRQRRRRRRGQRAVGAGHRHRRLDPPARRAVRDRRPQAHLRRRQPLRDDRLRLVPRPGRAAHARRHRRRAALRATWSATTTATRRRSPSPRSRAADGPAPRRHPPRRARGPHRRGRRARRDGALRGHARPRAGPRRDRRARRRSRTPTTA